MSLCSHYIINLLRIFYIFILLLFSLLILKGRLLITQCLVWSIYIHDFLIKLIVLTCLLAVYINKLRLLRYKYRRISRGLKSNIVFKEIILITSLNVLVDFSLLSHFLYFLNDILKYLKKLITTSVFKIQRDIANSWY